MAPPPAAKTRQRISGKVAEILAEKIHSGELPDGSLLPSERQLSETYGASRTSVREAILVLQSSGLVSIRDRARARVTKLSSSAFMDQLSEAARTLLSQPNGVVNFQEARLMFECGLARHAAQHASPKQIEKLRLALFKNEEAIGNPDLFAETDLGFHNVLAEIPDNPIFTALNASLASWLMSQRTVAIMVRTDNIMAKAYEGHHDIYEAVVARDVARADAAMAAHLQAMSSAYWEAMHGGESQA
jgi:GntR family transcriptional regulator, sialic acid-inducible nan operon repressor